MCECGFRVRAFGIATGWHNHGTSMVQGWYNPVQAWYTHGTSMVQAWYNPVQGWYNPVQGWYNPVLDVRGWYIDVHRCTSVVHRVVHHGTSMYTDVPVVHRGTSMYISGTSMYLDVHQWYIDVHRCTSVVHRCTSMYTGGKRVVHRCGTYTKRRQSPIETAKPSKATTNAETSIGKSETTTTSLPPMRAPSPVNTGT